MEFCVLETEISIRKKKNWRIIPNKMIYKLAIGRGVCEKLNLFNCYKQAVINNCRIIFRNIENNLIVTDELLKL